MGGIAAATGLFGIGNGIKAEKFEIGELKQMSMIAADVAASVAGGGMRIQKALEAHLCE